MGAIITNVAKGKWAEWGGLPGSGDKFIWVLLTAGSGADDDAIRDSNTLTELLATNVNEASFTGYSIAPRLTATVSVSVDDATNSAALDADDPVWNPTTAEALTRIALCYDPDGGNNNGSIIPVFIDDFAMTTPVTGSITYQVATGGCMKAS